MNRYDRAIELFCFVAVIVMVLTLLAVIAAVLSGAGW